MAGGTNPFETIARSFVDAFNRRDADGLVALSHPDIVWRPTMLVGSRRVYHGHDGLRRWVSDLRGSPLDHTANVHEVRVLDRDRFLVISEVLSGQEAVAPSAMLARLTDANQIIEAQGYLTDEDMLEHLGHLPASIGDARPG